MNRFMIAVLTVLCTLNAYAANFYVANPNEIYIDVDEPQGFNHYFVCGYKVDTRLEPYATAPGDQYYRSVQAYDYRGFKVTNNTLKADGQGCFSMHLKRTDVYQKQVDVKSQTSGTFYPVVKKYEPVATGYTEQLGKDVLVEKNNPSVGFNYYLVSGLEPTKGQVFNEVTVKVATPSASGTTSNFQNVTIYDEYGQPVTASGFDLYTDADGYANVYLKQSDIKGKSIRLVTSSEGVRPVVTLKAAGVKPPTKPPQIVDVGGRYFKQGQQAGQIIAEAYNESIAMTAYIRYSIANGLTTELYRALIQALGDPAAIVSDSEQGEIYDVMINQAEKLAAEDTSSQAKSKANKYVKQQYYNGADNGEFVDPSEVLAVSTPEFTPSNPSFENYVNSPVKESDFSNEQKLQGLLVNSSTARQQYADILNKARANWPRNLFRSGMVYDINNWKLSTNLKQGGISDSLQFAKDGISMKTLWYLLRSQNFSSNDYRLVQASQILSGRQEPAVQMFIYNGFIYGFLRSLINTTRELENKLYQIELSYKLDMDTLSYDLDEQRRNMIATVAKNAALTNFKYRFYQAEFSDVYYDSAVDSFDSSFQQAVKDGVNYYENNSVPSYSEVLVEYLPGSKVMGVYSTFSYDVIGLKNYGKKPIREMKMQVSFSGAQHGDANLTGEFKNPVEFGQTSDEIISTSTVYIPASRSNLGKGKSQSVSLSASGTTLATEKIKLNYAKYVENFGAEYSKFCPKNDSGHAQRKRCNDMRTAVARVLIDEIKAELKDAKRTKDYSYYDSAQSDSVIWDLQNMTSKGLRSLMNDDYKGSNRRSILKRVKDTRPGVFGGRKEKKMFDKAFNLLKAVR